MASIFDFGKDYGRRPPHLAPLGKAWLVIWQNRLHLFRKRHACFLFFQLFHSCFRIDLKLRCFSLLSAVAWLSLVSVRDFTLLHKQSHQDSTSALFCIVKLFRLFTFLTFSTLCTRRAKQRHVRQSSQQRLHFRGTPSCHLTDQGHNKLSLREILTSSPLLNSFFFVSMLELQQSSCQQAWPTNLLTSTCSRFRTNSNVSVNLSYCTLFSLLTIRVAPPYSLMPGSQFNITMSAARMQQPLPVSSLPPSHSQKP